MVPHPFPFSLTVLSALAHSFPFPSSPFSRSHFLALYLHRSLSFSLRPLSRLLFSTVCCFTHTLTYVYPLYSRAHTHTHTHTRVLTRVSVSDTRTRYAFLVGCIFQNCGHSYSAPCNMHAVWRVRTVTLEAFECNTLGRETNRKEERYSRRGGGEERTRGDGRTGRGEGGFGARCSGQCGGLTGVRVTGPHIGGLRVTLYVRRKKRER